ncbi:MAG: hypothetical protein AVDCRST_MAG87-3261, partial [uncultured Thermomicrobiales bacterium]
ARRFARGRWRATPSPIADRAGAPDRDREPGPALRGELVHPPDRAAPAPLPRPASRLLPAEHDVPRWLGALGHRSLRDDRAPWLRRDRQPELRRRAGLFPALSAADAGASGRQRAGRDRISAGGVRDRDRDWMLPGRGPALRGARQPPVRSGCRADGHAAAVPLAVQLLLHRRVQRIALPAARRTGVQLYRSPLVDAGRRLRYAGDLVPAGRAGATTGLAPARLEARCFPAHADRDRDRLPARHARLRALHLVEIRRSARLLHRPAALGRLAGACLVLRGTLPAPAEGGAARRSASSGDRAQRGPARALDHQPALGLAAARPRDRPVHDADRAHPRRDDLGLAGPVPAPGDRLLHRRRDPARPAGMARVAARPRDRWLVAAPDDADGPLQPRLLGDL